VEATRAFVLIGMNNHRPLSLLAAFALLALLVAPLISPLFAAEPKPNVLVFLVDDMGVMDTSVPFLSNAAGTPERHPLNRLFRTPNMQRLADQGIRFERFYANSVCSPTRVSIMTGQSSARHRTTQYIKPESNNAGKFGPPNWRWEGIAKGDQTLPARLREAGYRTIHAGKAHFGPIDSFGSLPQNFGFDVNIAGCAYGLPGSYYGTEHFGHLKRKNRAVPGLEKYHGQDIHLTEATTREMRAAVTAAVEAEKPFFAYLSHYAVHSPFQSDKRFAANYADAKHPGPKQGPLAKNAKAFATMIEGMDKSLGDMLDHLETLGVATNTLVLFLGDNGSDAPLGSTHGVACAAPLRGKKGTHYEGGLRVPFIAAWAKPDADHAAQKALPIPLGKHSQAVGRVYDLVPTIAALTGATFAGALDGVDLAPALSGKKQADSETFLMHFPHDHRSDYYSIWIEGDFKLVYHYHRKAGERCELFNLAEDPFEANNLASSEPEKRKAMIEALAAVLADADAQYVRSKTDETVVLKPVVK